MAAWMAGFVNLRLPDDQFQRFKAMVAAGWTPEQVLAQLFEENRVVRKVIVDNRDFIEFLVANKKWFLQNPERFLNYLLACARSY